MAELLKFQNANELREKETLEQQLTEARQIIIELRGRLMEAESISGIWHMAALDAEEEVQMLLDDVAHGHQRVKFVQRENEHLKRKIDTLEAELAAQKKKYELAMTWWRYEGAD